MGDEEPLESLDRHFLIGNAWLTTAQFNEHASRGSCEQCDEIAAFAMARPAYASKFASSI